MCTVTFVRSGGKTIITSNRDEQVLRPSLAPIVYKIASKSVIFPKDPRGGGTWFASDESGNVLVLLNGAAEKHHHQPPYRMSRGMIAVDIIGASSPWSMWNEIDLTNIEPFTVVLYQDSRLYQLRWNGTGKNSVALDPKQSHIWSSSTLYSADIRRERAAWFSDFLSDEAQISPEELMRFHRYTEAADSTNGLVINRNGFLKTLSITQAVIEDGHVAINHTDLASEKNYTVSFQPVRA